MTRDEDVRVVVPDEPLDTSDPTVAKALLGLLRRYTQIEAAPITDLSSVGFTTCGKREPAPTAPYEPAAPRPRLRAVEDPAGPDPDDPPAVPADATTAAHEEEPWPGLAAVLDAAFRRTG